jgi:hypothetical protein
VHGGHRVDGGDLDPSSGGVLDDDAARQHRPDFVLRLQRPVSVWGVAGSEDAVVAEIDVELLFERGLDVDIREDAEPFLLELGPDPVDGRVEVVLK